MSFYSTIRPILVIFMLFGQLPLYGVLYRKPSRWQLRWCSFQTVLCLVLMVVGLFLCVVEYDRLQVIGVNADNIIGPLFYADVIIIMLLLLRVAHHWPSMVAKWDQVEAMEVMQYNARQQDTRSTRRIRAIALLLLSMGFVEHMLSIGKTVYAKVDEGRVCNWEYSNLPEYYALRTYGFLFRRVPYSFPSFIFLEYANTALTMAWTVQDVLLIMITDSIGDYFNRINARIQFYSNVQVIAREKFWSEIHSDYVVVCELLEHVMSICSPLLVVSCGTNLYLICYQLFHLVGTEKFIIMSVFTYYSLCFVILRTFLTLHHCSAVHEVALKPLKLCRRIPTKGWCEELERFYTFIRKTSIAVSAMGLFQLTKRTMLTMLGAVITYELVMLHFAQSTANQGIVRECSTEEFLFEPKMESSAN
ncbi:gustatory receptor for sugar taste 64a-like [Anopheles maculipalpis]|uniref:gustatory receptor for sugar taste 64a-like n=1 Tax=Anopheles maculipalpis TaxID=1496333 RepID=UPI002158C9A8|nr:gustatory receptor for sugar taste 64a-like [Anopheles maculipalpis]